MAPEDVSAIDPGTGARSAALQNPTGKSHWQLVALLYSQSLVGGSGADSTPSSRQAQATHTHPTMMIGQGWVQDPIRTKLS